VLTYYLYFKNKKRIYKIVLFCSNYLYLQKTNNYKDMEQEKNPFGVPFRHTAEEMQQKYIDYCNWISTQYDTKYDFIKSGERAGETIAINYPKVKSIQSFCHYIGVTYRAFKKWYDGERVNASDDFVHIITRIYEDLIEDRASKALNGVINASFLMAIDNYKQNVEVNQNVTVNALPINIGTKAIDLTELEYQVLENE
jgi:hypothetical protein